MDDMIRDTVATYLDLMRAKIVDGAELKPTLIQIQSDLQACQEDLS